MCSTAVCHSHAILRPRIHPTTNKTSKTLIQFVPNWLGGRLSSCKPEQPARSHPLPHSLTKPHSDPNPLVRLAHNRQCSTNRNIVALWDCAENKRGINWSLGVTPGTTEVHLAKLGGTPVRHDPVLGSHCAGEDRGTLAVVHARYPALLSLQRFRVGSVSVEGASEEQCGLESRLRT